MSIIKTIISHFSTIPCPACKDEIQDNKKVNFCSNCYSKLNFIQPPFCPCCGGHLDGILDLCSKCLKEPTAPWENGFSVLSMKDFSRMLIRRFKYGNDTSLARPLGLLASQVIDKSSLDLDIITHIPLHWFKRLKRGYNQSSLIVKIISSQTSLKHLNLLTRKKYTKSQTKLSHSMREKNLLNAFSVSKEAIIKNRVILLVDDVYTTGSTLRSATNALLEGGAKKIYILTLSRR